jgi:alkylhydroperoxidase family enzyme
VGGGATARERALLGYAARLTALATPMTEADLAPLRAVGLVDDEIRDLAQVVGYFAYVNRHVEGLGIELEPDHPGQRWAEVAFRNRDPA